MLTDQNGFYRFTGLATGTYTVRELVSADFAALGPAGALTQVIIPQGSTVSNVNFANLAMQPNATTAFVAELYGDLLDRAPDAAGLSNWVRKLNQGLSRDQVSRAVWESAEHRALQVDRLYQTFLHREADPVGRQGWMNALLSGMSEDQVGQGLVMSAEYQTSHRGDSAFVTGLYRDVLGREPDTVGSLVWQGALQSGMAKAQVALAFMTCDEAHLRGLDHYYGDFLHRQADAAGEQSWLALLHNGRISLDRTAELFIASDEYFAWARQLSKS